MTALLALAPCAAVIVSVLGFRLPSVIAALIASVVAFAIWTFGVFSPPTALDLQHTIADALVLELLVASVIVPGILFVEVSGRLGAPKAIGEAMGTLELRTPPAAILIAIGIGILIESLTGWGVSMLVTVPLLLNIVDRRQAIGLALVGMCLMPWGALGLAALLGAELASLSVPDLAAAVVWTSGPMAVALPILCLLFMPKRSVTDLAYAAVAGLVLIVAIALTSRWIGIEVAGVFGGMAVIALSIGVARNQRGLYQALFRSPLRLYLLLIASVILQKILVPTLATLGIAPAVETGRVTFAVLTSPGIALLTIAIAAWAVSNSGVHRRQETAAILVSAARRSWRPLASILLFMVTARLLVEGGAIAALSDLLVGLGVYVAAAAVTVLGAVSGFVTGGGLTGNALFMPSAAATGEIFDALALFAALQHSAAGHASMAALPIAAILLAALPDRRKSDDRTVMKTALGLGAVGVLLPMLSGWLQIWYFH